MFLPRSGKVRKEGTVPTIALLLAVAVIFEPACMAADAQKARELTRFPAREAHQGVAVGPAHFYAIDNARIGKYEKDTGKRVGGWEGAPDGPIQHLNSCIVKSHQLICAHSNYPALPMTSSLEFFDTRSMEHSRTRSFGIRQGSLTWAEWHDDAWWLAFANYGGGRGNPARDWRWTTVVRFDSDFQREEGWILPGGLLDRLAPYSTSGGTWGRDGSLFITGHHRQEIYVLALPGAGSTLRHLETIAIPTGGQAIDFDPADASLLYSIDRSTHEVVVSSRLPPSTPGN